MEMLVSEPSPTPGTPHKSPPVSPPLGQTTTLHPAHANTNPAVPSRPVSLSLDASGLGVSSNFPSPSSSFLPPPIPGAEEFAIKRPPKGRGAGGAGSRKNSVVNAAAVLEAQEKENKATPADSLTVGVGGAKTAQAKKSPSPSPTTPTPPAAPNGLSIHPTSSANVESGPNSAVSGASSNATPTGPYSTGPPPPSPSKNAHRLSTQSLAGPPSSSSAPVTAASSPKSATHNLKRLSSLSIQSANNGGEPSPSSPSLAHHRLSSLSTLSAKLPSTPPASYTTFHQGGSTASLQSNRPAPPSPAVSRRASGVPGTPSLNSSDSAKEYFPIGIGAAPGGSPDQHKRTLSSSSSLRRASGKGKKRQSSLSSVAALVAAGDADEGAEDVGEEEEGVFEGDGKGTIRASGAGHRRPKSITTGLQTPFTPPPTAKVKWNPIIVRDFAFEEADDRSKGLGADCPKSNRLRTLNKPLYMSHRASTMSAMTTASSTTSSKFRFETEEDGGPPMALREPSSETTGSHLGLEGFDIPGFKWGRWSWALKRDVDDRAQEPHFPDSDPEEADEDEEGGLLGEEEPLYPGIYRAMYAFEPEPGSVEMALEEGQEVRVLGRGGGPGWVVVISEEGSDGQDGEERKEKHALVPEGYLEVVQLDEWDVEEVEQDEEQ